MLRRSLPGLLLATTCLVGCAPESGAQAVDPVPAGSGHDFLVVSLSWSPSYCLREGDDANWRQCAPERDLGFVVHGLWPQFEEGWPEFCESAEPDRVPQALVDDYLDLIPSAGLIGHQWRKHGTCTGLSQADYLRLTRLAREAVVVPEASAGRAVDPDAIEAAFLADNPDLTPGGIAVTCSGGLLEEVRICLTPALGFRDCPEVDARSCTARAVQVPAP